VATFYVTVDFLGGDSPGLTRTQNVASGDTVIVDFRGLGPEELIFGTDVNCSVTNNGASSSLVGGTQFTINSFSGSSYSAQFTDDDGQTWTLVGSVTTSEIYPASPTAANQFISTSATSVSIPIFGGVTTAEAYSLCVTPGLTTNVEVVNDRISAMTPYVGGNFTVSGGDLPTYGQTKYYYIYSYRYPAYGGAGQYYYASSFYIFRPFIPPSTSATCANTTIAATYTGSLTLPLLNADFADEAYRLCRTGGTKTFSQIAADQIGDTILRGGSTSFTIIDSELPTAGNTEDYTVYAYRYPDAGGQGVYVEAGTFYVTRSAAASDTTPNAFDLGGPVSDAELSTLTFSSTITVSGINAATPISISGSGSPVYSVNGGSFTATSGTVLNGNEVQVRVTSSASNNTSVTATLNIGGVTDTFTVTTIASGGGGVTPGSNTYGLEVAGPSGAIIFSPNFKVCNLAVLTAFSISGGGVADFPCDSAQFANKVAIIVDTGSRFANENTIVTRQTNNIRLTNTHTTAVSGQLVAIRIA
jgi:hypothetical protein